MDLIAAGVLFHGQATEPFITAYGFETADMSAIEASNSIKDVQVRTVADCLISALRQLMAVLNEPHALIRQLLTVAHEPYLL